MNEPVASPSFSAASTAAAAGRLRRRVRIVMVETSHPGNVGSAARAMKTMGLADLVLVAPKLADVLEQPNALALASGATDILAGARVVSSLAEALGDTSFAVAFTARRRELSHPLLPLRDAVGRALQQAIEVADAPVALVFGNEAMCLSNEDVDRCQLAATIPSNPEYSSLNVSQSVQVAAYEVMMQSGAYAVLDHAPRPAASAGEIEHFLRHLEQAAIECGFLAAATPKKFMTRMQRLFTRARLEPEEVAIFRGLLAALQAPRPAGERDRRINPE
jgi:tRNA/rRNA methyltransferase